MMSLPIPFVVAFLLAILAGSNHHALKESTTGRLFEWVLYLNTLGMVLVGVRWSWDIVIVLPLVDTLSVISSALLYLAFLSLGRHGAAIDIIRDKHHTAPALCVAICTLTAPHWTELLLIIIKLAYITLFIQLAYHYPDSLQLVRLSWLKNSQRALWAVVSLHLISLAVDIAIILDFILYDGHHAANLVSFVSLVILFFLGYVAILAGRGNVLAAVSDNGALEGDDKVLDSTNGNNKNKVDSNRSSDEHSSSARLANEPYGNNNVRSDKLDNDTLMNPSQHPSPQQGGPHVRNLDTNAARAEKKARTQLDTATETTSTDSDSKALMEKLNKLLVDDKHFADTELNLQRFARKAGLPARTISRTVNANTGQNISQWVNSARIQAACELLKNNPVSINQAMMESGFITKSNFNREFRRIMGSSPSEWRERHSPR